MDKRKLGRPKGSQNLMPGEGRLRKLQRDRERLRAARAQKREEKTVLSHPVLNQSPVAITSQPNVNNRAANWRQSFTLATIESTSSSPTQSPQVISPPNPINSSNVGSELSVTSQPQLSTPSTTLSSLRRAVASENEASSSPRQSPPQASHHSTSD